MKDIERRIEEERKKQREWSHLEYENYRRKYETSVQNTSFYNEKMRVCTLTSISQEVEKETRENLGYLDLKLTSGWDRSVMRKVEKAQRATVYTDKVTDDALMVCRSRG